MRHFSCYIKLTESSTKLIMSSLKGKSKTDLEDGQKKSKSDVTKPKIRILKRGSYNNDTKEKYTIRSTTTIAKSSTRIAQNSMSCF